MTFNQKKELAQIIHDIDDHWTMLRACIVDQQWLYVALTITGLNNHVEKLRALIENKL